MKAILLCAGFGTRLHPYTRDCAKPLLPVQGRPILDHLLARLGDVPGLQEIHVVCNARFYPQFVRWRAEVAAGRNSADWRAKTKSSHR